MVMESDVINASADSLWAIARDFQGVALWSSNIDHIEGKGEPEFEGATCSERVCHVNNIGGYDKVVEKLTMFDDEKKELTYELTEGAPGFVLFAQNHWSVSVIGPNKSMIKMEVTMRLKKFAGFFLAGQMKKTVMKNVPMAIEELKLYAEKGEISDTKKARKEALAKKKKKKAA